MSLRPGEIFAGYTVERELGSGGMGSVYLAHHPRLPRYDALKLLRAELCADPAFVGRFEREADTVAQLDHPNIVAVYDRGSQDGQLWISMRFIDGTNAEKALDDKLAASRTEVQGDVDALKTAIQTCMAEQNHTDQPATST